MKTNLKSKALIPFVCLVALSSLIACGGSTGTNAAPPSATSPTGGSSSGDTVSITVVPSTASVVANSTQLFDATISGASNTTATWQVNGVTGGNSTLGTISSSGLYTAPAVSATMTFTVTAISNDDSTKSAIAVVTVSPASTGGTPRPVAVAITPTSANVVAKQTQQFSATVSGTTNSAVTWQVNGVSGGNNSTGTISSTGLYTAPAVTAKTSVTITAVSGADTTKSASAAVTITPVATSQPVSIAVAPTTASVVAGKTQQFSATVSGSSDTAVTWEVNGVSGGNSSTGTISSSGLYTAPTVSSTLSVTVTAVSSADNSKTASAAVTVSPASTPPPTSSGPALYVSPSGSDSNDGSSAHPFATINKAANTATPGMTVQCACPGGTYQAVTTSTERHWLRNAIRYISDVQYGAKVMGTSSSEAAWMQDGSYVDLVGFDISGGSRLGVENNGSHVKILGNYVHNIAGSCSSSGGAGSTTPTIRLRTTTSSGTSLETSVRARGRATPCKEIYLPTLAASRPTTSCSRSRPGAFRCGMRQRMRPSSTTRCSRVTEASLLALATARAALPPTILS